MFQRPRGRWRTANNLKKKIYFVTLLFFYLINVYLFIWCCVLFFYLLQNLRQCFTSTVQLIGMWLIGREIWQRKVTSPRGNWCWWLVRKQTVLLVNMLLCILMVLFAKSVLGKESLITYSHVFSVLGEYFGGRNFISLNFRPDHGREVEYAM